MQTSFYPIISSPKIILIAMNMLWGCSKDNTYQEDILRGTISYPVGETNQLGKRIPGEKLVIKSSVGNTEYVVEIPSAGEEFEITVPLAALSSQAQGGPDRPRNLAKPSVTDRELVNALPQITQNNKTALVDKAFGVGHGEGPRQRPSYTLGIAKVNKLYRSKQLEYALIELNNLLSFYPNSPKLHKMKGSILVKLGHLRLAEKTWLRASTLAPQDSGLKRGIDKLRAKMSREQALIPNIDTQIAPNRPASPNP